MYVCYLYTIVMMVLYFFTNVLVEVKVITIYIIDDTYV